MLIMQGIVVFMTLFSAFNDPQVKLKRQQLRNVLHIENMENTIIG